MPCSDSNDYTTAAAASAAVMKERADYLARMLCSACKQIEAAGTQPENPELLEWWTVHKAADKAREVREEQERKAIEETDKMMKEGPTIWILGRNW